MFDKVAAIIGESLDIDTTTITPDTELVRDLNINSIDVVNLVCELEQAFQVEIPDRQIGKFVRVRDVVEYLNQNAGEGAVV